MYVCMYVCMYRHHLREVNTFKLKLVKYLVFDEADRLFEMGVCMYEWMNEMTLCVHITSWSENFLIENKKYKKY